MWIEAAWGMYHSASGDANPWWYRDESAALLPFSDDSEVLIPFAQLMFRGGSVTSLTATMDTTAFYPYKTTAGLSAWNTSTGEATNGGPGA
jgi:hypothetical protein